MCIVVAPGANHNTGCRNLPCPCGRTNRFGPVKFKRCCGKGVRAKPTPSTPVIEFLRAVSFPYAWGEEKILTTNERAFVATYNRGRKRSLSNGDFNDHFGKVHKLYFYANPGWHAKKLVMIDIDVQKSQKKGSQNGAEAFARHVDELFAEWHFTGKTARGTQLKIYWEPSSSGVGLAGYFLIVGANVETVRAAYDHLDAVLKAHAKDFDIEGVEIKGKPPLITYGRRNIVGDPQISDITFGTLAKYPTGITTQDIDAIPDVLSPDILALKVPASDAPLPRDRNEKKSVSTEPQQVGSYGPIDPELLKRLPEFKKHAQNVFLKGDWRIDSPSSRAVVTAEDVALQAFLTWYMTVTDDTTAKPVKRFENLWNQLVKLGHTTRAYCRFRHKAVRDQLTVLGLLDWHNNEYWKSLGKDMPGQCCKYSANKGFEAVFLPPPTPLSIPCTTRMSLNVRMPLISPKRVPNPYWKPPVLVIESELELYEYEIRLAA